MIDELKNIKEKLRDSAYVINRIIKELDNQDKEILDALKKLSREKGRSTDGVPIQEIEEIINKFS